MDLKPVKSSNISKVGYDEESKELQVEFRGGSLYAYDGVPAEAHAALIRAASIGSQFSKTIKDKYKHRKLK